MGTHTFTTKGLVDNKCNKSIMFTILQLENDLENVKTQIKACHENGMDAFLSLFQEDNDRLVNQINSLLLLLSTNVNETVA